VKGPERGEERGERALWHVDPGPRARGFCMSPTFARPAYHPAGFA
jgi:hypothetical protein